MNKSEFLTGLQEELEFESKLAEDTNFKQMDEWDSMAAMILIGYVSDNFNITLNAEDLKSIDSMSALMDKIGIK